VFMRVGIHVACYMFIVSSSLTSEFAGTQEFVTSVLQYCSTLNVVCIGIRVVCCMGTRFRSRETRPSYVYS
jgi:hypothetical protein